MEYLQPWLKKIRCVGRDYSQHGDQQQLPKIETKIRWIRFQISWLETDKQTLSRSSMKEKKQFKNFIKRLLIS